MPAPLARYKAAFTPAGSRAVELSPTWGGGKYADDLSVAARRVLAHLECSREPRGRAARRLRQEIRCYLILLGA